VAIGYPGNTTEADRAVVEIAGTGGQALAIQAGWILRTWSPTSRSAGTLALPPSQ